MLSIFTLATGLSLSGCVRVPFNVPAPPPVPQAVRAPDPPQLQSEPTDFTPEATEDVVGQQRLRLKRSVIGLGPIAATDFVGDIHDALLRSLVEGGFRSVLDLDASSAVEATHTRAGRGEEVQLHGRMTELMELVPVSRAAVLVTGEVRSSRKEARRLPVRFWYEDTDLDAYMAQLESYDAARQQRLAELEKVRADYLRAYEDAEAAYQESRPWWQKMLDGVVEPPESKARAAFVGDVRRVSTSMSRDPESVDALKTAAEQRQEAREVEIYTASLRLHVVDPASGQVLVVADLGAEGRTPDELVDNLTSVAQATLGER